MKKLYLYAIFHANLSFSSIPEEKYSKVIDRSYWPLLELIREGHRLGLEFSSSTLKTISEIDPKFISELKTCWKEGFCEVIGSSYIQSIFPLIPNTVNKRNIEKGLKDYVRILGRQPDIAFINEQTFSKGLPELYKNAGYSGLIMDWDNAAEFNQYPQCLRYQPVKVSCADGSDMRLLWNSSLNSYKFQRCIYGRISKEDFAGSIAEHYSSAEDRALAIYGTDWEIFNFRPSTLEEKTGEIDKIGSVLRMLAENEKVELILPSSVLERIPVEKEVQIESPESPIPCKNRDDYNVLRWAVSGRDDVQINTQCYRLWNKIANLEYIEGQEKVADCWDSLNFVWGSDFRTRTTDEKFYGCRNRMGQLESELDRRLVQFANEVPLDHEFTLVNPLEDVWDREPFEADLNFAEGQIYYDKIGVMLNGIDTKCQAEAREYYRDGSLRSVKLVMTPRIKPGEVVCGKLYEKKEYSSFPDDIQLDPISLAMKTAHVDLKLASDTGGDIRELSFPSINENSLIGYLPPVYYDHIGHSSDYYSGGIMVNDMFGHIRNDTVRATINMPDNLKAYPVRIPVALNLQTAVGTCTKTYYIYTDRPRIDLNYQFYLKDIAPIFFRLGILTFNPNAFDRKSLRFQTTNGTETIEAFYVKGKKVKHNECVQAFSSGRACLGATEGWIDISDQDKGVLVATDKSKLYSVPLIEYEEIKRTYLLRLFNTISESDETGKISWRGKNDITFSIMGHNGNVDQVRQAAKQMNRKLILIEKGSDGKRKCI